MLWFQVMTVLTDCPNHMSSDFRNICAGVNGWVRRLKGKNNDKDHSDFMVSKFQCHMEDGLFHVPVADVLRHWEPHIAVGILTGP